MLLRRCIYPDIPYSTAVLGRFGFTGFADAIDFLLDREFVETGEGQTKEQANPALKHHEGIAKRAFYLLRRSLNTRGIGNTPVRGHRLAGSDGTNFLGSVVTDREYEIELRCAGLGEPVPVLASQAFDRQPRNF